MNQDNRRGVPWRAQCLCATVAYEDPEWNSHYYPEECPEDWRLAYYMNDFRSVYLPRDAWQGDMKQVETIAAELDETFELIVEWPTLDAMSDLQPTLSSLHSLKDNITCVVISTDGLSREMLDASCQAVGAHYSINLDSHRLDNTGREELAERYQTGFVWRPVQPTNLFQAPEFQVVLLPCLSLREIKSILDQLVPLLTQGIRSGLFIEPAAQSAGRAKEVRTLIELKGLA